MFCFFQRCIRILSFQRSMSFTAVTSNTAPSVNFNDKERFLLDLEFIQALANPDYLKFLAQHSNNYFSDPDFISYLAYLQYWHKPEYAVFISFPHCLFILDVLQQEDVRNQLRQPFIIDWIREQQNLHWRHHYNVMTKKSSDSVQSDIDEASQNVLQNASQKVS